MALRFLLVSLVAGVGVGMPSGRGVSRWGASGRGGGGGRMGELGSIKLGPEQAEEAVAVAETSPVSDLAFDVVVEGMAADFAADLASVVPDRPAPEVLVEEGRSADPSPVAWVDPEPAPIVE